MKIIVFVNLVLMGILVLGEYNIIDRQAKLMLQEALSESKSDLVQQQINDAMTVAGRITSVRVTLSDGVNPPRWAYFPVDRGLEVKTDHEAAKTTITSEDDRTPSSPAPSPGSK